MKGYSIGHGDRLIATVIPFPSYEGNANVAMGDVDGDGVLDLIVGSGKNHAPEVVVYSGSSILGKGIFGTELARFQPFDSVVRAGVSVASAQIDGSPSDNLIVGSGAGITDEVKIYNIPLAGSNRGPILFAAFKPLAGQLGGAKSIIASQLAGNGSVKAAPNQSSRDAQRATRTFCGCSSFQA